MVPRSQYDPTTKMLFQLQNKRSIYDKAVFTCRTLQGIQYANYLLLTQITGRHAVFVAIGVLTLTGGESVLFVLRSRANVASVEP